MNQSKSINYFFYFLVILILLIGTIYYFRDKESNDQPEYVKNKLNELKDSEIKLKKYKNDLHKLTISYPENWQQLDLGGDKNVTEPLKAENIILFFDSKADVDPSASPLASASTKIKRYVIEQDRQINSQDSWFDYIKEKVDIAKDSDIAQVSGYQLTSLNQHDDINGLWAVEENYTESDDIKGRDIYLFDDDQLYQIICTAKQVVFDSYQPYFEAVINSFKIGENE